MRTRHDFVGHIQALRPHDFPLALGARELLRLADADGGTPRDPWVTALRAGLEHPDASEPTDQEEGETPFPENSAVPPEVEVVERLEARGIARREPGGPDWSHLRWNPRLWEALREERQDVLTQVDEVVRNLHSGHQGGVSGSTVSVPHTGSRLGAEGLQKVFGGRAVVDDVAISVEQGETVGLLGPNGAGKTTTFYMIVGLIPPDAGRVYLDEREITRVPMYRRARLGVGYLAQEPSVFRKLTVEENVLAILETLGLPRKEQEERLETLLKELSIEPLRKSKAYSLSGGERRRLEITRALVQQPKFMLLDEPFAGIDPIAVNDIQQIVAGLRHRGIGVIISDHNVEQTLDIVDRAYIMYEGRIRVSGTVSELVWNDEVAEIYFGPTLTERMRQRYPQPAATS